MGVVSLKSVLSGLFGGVTVSKKTGQQTLHILSVGPKVDKVRSEEPIPNPNLIFGTPVDCSLLMAEQKFSDFNGSFTDCKSIQIRPATEVSA